MDYFNNIILHGKLQKLLHRNYFRYFSYDNKKSCQFWSPDRSNICYSPICQVEICSKDQLPDFNPCDYVDETILDEIQSSLQSWNDHDNSLKSVCNLNEEELCQDCDSVDLTLNSEKYTGYKGNITN